jgi:hypothetical protein
MALVKILLVSFIIFNFGILQDASSQTEIDYSDKLNSAIRFFNNKLGIKIDPQNARIKTSSSITHLGYFNKQDSTIEINKRLNEVESKLTIVHELSHLIRSSHVKNEVLWLDEGLAKLTEFLYSGVWPVSYINFVTDRNRICLSSNPKFYGLNGEGYSSSFYFVYYLYRNFGRESFLSHALASNQTGWKNILETIMKTKAEGQHGIPDEYLNRESIIRHFALSFVENSPYKAIHGLLFFNSFHKFIPSTKKMAKPCLGQKEFSIYFEDVSFQISEKWHIKREPFEIRNNPPIEKNGYYSISIQF